MWRGKQMHLSHSQIGCMDAYSKVKYEFSWTSLWDRQLIFVLTFWPGCAGLSQDLVWLSKLWRKNQLPISLAGWQEVILLDNLSSWECRYEVFRIYMVDKNKSWRLPQSTYCCVTNHRNRNQWGQGGFGPHFFLLQVIIQIWCQECLTRKILAPHSCNSSYSSGNIDHSILLCYKYWSDTWLLTYSL